MNAIDLIPSDYRVAQWQAAWMKRFAGVMIALLLLSLAFSAGLTRTTRSVTADVQQLEKRNAAAGQLQTEFERLRARRLDYQQQLDLLSGLRSGAAVENLIVAVDRALSDGEIWFLKWTFQRAGFESAGESSGAATSQRQSPEAWQIETHMRITGEARDHSALSRFVQELFTQPGIQNARVNKTFLRRYGDIRVVGFDLAIVVNSDVTGV